MTSHKLQKFCRLTKYIEQIDKEFYQVFDDLCLFGLFRGRDGRGITFLYPSDKSYRKSIINNAYSDSPEIAIQQIKSLILLDYFPIPKQFTNTANSMNLEVIVDKITADSVLLKSGHTLKLDKNFKKVNDGDKFVVYIFDESKEFDMTGKKISSKKISGKKGGSSNIEQSTEILITECIEYHYGKGYKDIYMAFLSACYENATDLKDQLPAQAAIYNRICASARASFYSILSPWSAEKDFDISTILKTNGFESIISCDTGKITEFIKLYSAKYDENLKNFINKVSNAKIQGTVQENNQNGKSPKEIANEILNRSKNIIEIKPKLIAAYNNNQSKLYKDTLTIYCYLAALNEKNDRNYFNNVFRYSMKNIFNHSTSFHSSVHDVVYSMTLIVNLLKSDAFLFTPTDILTKRVDYIDEHGELPNPNDKNTFFTIAHSTQLKEKYGGSSDDSFFGGICDRL